MSNELAIATVTATIQKIIQNAIEIKVPGTLVTKADPPARGEGIPKKQINIHMCQAGIYIPLQNNDSPQRPKGSNGEKQTQTPLELYYLISFHGNQEKSEPQILMATTIGAIRDNPTFDREMIDAAINDPENDYLLNSNLSEQVGQINVAASKMKSSEMQKFWSSYFGLPAPLFFVFEVNAILIDGIRPGRKALPVRGIAFYGTTTALSISKFVSNTGTNQPVLSNGILVIHGTNFDSSNLYVKIGDTKLKPHKLESQKIKLDLTALSNDERGALRAGVQSLQVFQQVPKQAKYEPQRVTSSNVVPFVLCPKVVTAKVANISENEHGILTAEIKVELDLTVGVTQRVLLFLNERSAPLEAAYIFNANPRLEDGKVITFTINDVKRGEYLVRVQVDGAESTLEVDTQPQSQTFDQYISPIVMIE